MSNVMGNEFEWGRIWLRDQRRLLEFTEEYISSTKVVAIKLEESKKIHDMFWK